MSRPDPDRTGADPVRIFAALGDTTRLALIKRLSDGQARSIARLSQGTGLTRQGITKHLEVLGRAGLVHAQRVGREKQFFLDSGSIKVAGSYLDAVSEQWDDALMRLRGFVEDAPE